MKKKGLRFSLALFCLFFLVSADQIVKVLINSKVAEGTSVSFVPYVLSLTHLHNTGAAWSIMQGRQIFFAVITIVVVAFVFYYLWKFICVSKLVVVSLTLIASGALGNFIDRMRNGYVIDLFKTEFINFPVFNVADIYLTVGFLFLVVYLFIFERDNGTKRGSEKR